MNSRVIIIIIAIAGLNAPPVSYLLYIIGPLAYLKALILIYRLK